MILRESLMNESAGRDSHGSITMFVELCSQQTVWDDRPRVGEFRPSCCLLLCLSVPDVIELGHCESPSDAYTSFRSSSP